jgi:hypothetical protein
MPSVHTRSPRPSEAASRTKLGFQNTAAVATRGARISIRRCSRLPDMSDEERATVLARDRERRCSVFAFGGAPVAIRASGCWGKKRPCSKHLDAMQAFP